MERLQRPALTTWRTGMTEVAVFSRSLRVFAGAAAPHAPGVRGGGPGGLAGLALRGAFVAATIVLFLAWLSASPSHRSVLWGFVPGSECVSYGRGGAHCLAPAAADVHSNADVGSQPDCVSLGRGGLLCKARAGGEGRPG
jgi:hypothetical protein